LAKAIGLKMLIVDELHQIADGSARRQQHFLNVLKYLSNELSIAIVCAGNDEALSIITSDRQMESRFETVELPLWDEGDELSALLDTLELCLPLRRASDLGSEELARLILSSSDRTLDSILKTVRAAAERAILTGAECINRKVILGHDAGPDADAGRRAG
jgi:hypothetical protein